MAASGRFTKTVDGCDFAYKYVCTKCSMDNEAILYCPKCSVYYCNSCLQKICKHTLLGQDDQDRWEKKTDYHVEFKPNVAGETNLADSERDLQSYAQQLRQRADHIKRDRTSRQADVQTRKSASRKSVRKTPSRPPTSSPRPYKAGNKRDVSVKVKGDKNICTIEGVCQLPDGSIVVSDGNNKKLKKLDGSYKVTCHCSLPKSSRGVCHIDGNEVAVALDNRTIQFVSVGDSITLTGSISLDHDCLGVAHHQDRLYVTGGSRDAALYVYSISGTQLHVFTKDQNGQNIFSNPWYIALSPSGNTIYVADVDKGLVTMDAQGHVLATFSSSDLKRAVCVAVADDGSVFVGGVKSHNVIQVVEEGNKKLAEVVTSSAGIEMPNGICLDRRGSKLIVGMIDDDCLAVFDLTQ